MKHRAFTLFEVIVVLVIVGVIAAILYPVFMRPREIGHRPSCQSPLKQMALGFKQYIQDYDEKYPPASVAWATVYLPYTKSTQILQCPVESTPPIATLTTDYFFNARLLGVDEAKLNSISTTIAMGDGAGNQKPNYTLSQLPLSWRTDQSSPAWRHLDGANYSFADGHVKWLKADKITLQNPALNQPTFRVK